MLPKYFLIHEKSLNFYKIYSSWIPLQGYFPPSVYILSLQIKNGWQNTQYLFPNDKLAYSQWLKFWGKV